MLTRAYILIETEVGKAASVVEAVRSLDLPQATKLLSADVVTGPFDVIVVAETTDLDKLMGPVTDPIQMIDGGRCTTTCVAPQAEPPKTRFSGEILVPRTAPHSDPHTRPGSFPLPGAHGLA